VNPPAFWWRSGASLPARLLSPLAALYGRAVARRMEREPGFRAGVPVLCVGNYTVGGEGKTPTALALRDLLADIGGGPAFLSRGYGGSETGPVMVDPARHTAAEVGDEALLLAAAAPTLVSRDRAAGARRLAEGGAGLVIMDDGFQNPELARDFSLIVVDAGRGVGNRQVLPAGPLRAPLAVQAARTDALLVIGDGEGAKPVVEAVRAVRDGIPVFHGRLAVAEAGGWAGRRVLAYAGIGRPEKFFRSLVEAGAEVVDRTVFPDHHAFTEAEAAALLARGEAHGLELATTAKDLARLAGRSGAAAVLRQRSKALPVRLEFGEPEAVRTAILSGIGRSADI
jgi:tetraacyldisaccharide 4'-kinase